MNSKSKAKAAEARTKAKQRHFLVVRAEAEQGDAIAQLMLGVYYSGGDDVEAEKWFRKAAEQGVPSAQFWLGTSYFGGEGVAKDVVEGYAWMILFDPTLAVVFGEEMTPQEIEAACKRADLSLVMAIREMGFEEEMTPQEIGAAYKRAKELRAIVETNKKAKGKVAK